MTRYSFRIQGGIYRGSIVRAPPPSASGQANFTTALMKEAFFQLLENSVDVRTAPIPFWDLCAGSGQMGLEALSRGFSPVHLNEPDNRRFSFLLKNLGNFRSEVVLHNKDFRRLALALRDSPEQVLYIDPPYSFWNPDGCPPIDEFCTRIWGGDSSATGADDGLRKSSAGFSSDQYRNWIIAVQGPQPYQSWRNTLPTAKTIPAIHAEFRSYRKQTLTILTFQ